MSKAEYLSKVLFIQVEKNTIWKCAVTHRTKWIFFMIVSYWIAKYSFLFVIAAEPGLVLFGRYIRCPIISYYWRLQSQQCSHALNDAVYITCMDVICITQLTKLLPQCFWQITSTEFSVKSCLTETSQWVQLS